MNFKFVEDGGYRYYHHPRLKLKVIIAIFILIIIFVLVNRTNLYSTFCNCNGYTIKELNNYFIINDNNIDVNKKITIALLDSGIDPEIISQDKILFFKDFINYKSSTYDDNGHGTDIASIIVGNDEYEGINDTLELVSLKVINKNSISPYYALINSLKWVINNCSEYNIKFICMSFGFSERLYLDQYLLDLFKIIGEKGIVVVTSAGNTGDNRLSFPALLDNVISVGSLNYVPNSNININNSYMSEFSCFSIEHNKPDLYAPGENIIVPFNNTDTKDKCHKLVSGTSYSAGMVCAQLATLYQVYNISSSNIIEELTKYFDNSIVFGDETQGVYNYE